ncbi:hypothetical protein FQN49_007085 [Arthroderma sp. PD_2]|nr:hypothetical protein FQN49_007085 [Arthroderma sp. PD_2]
MRVSGLSILALYGAASLAATIPETNSNTTPANKDATTIAPRGETPQGAAAGVSACYYNTEGADYSGWYQECMDKLAKSIQGSSSGSGYEATAGNITERSGCVCSYGERRKSFSSAEKEWPTARQKLWDDIVNKDHTCNEAIFFFRPEGEGEGFRRATLDFRCA